MAEVASRFQQLRDRHEWVDHLVRAGARYTERHGNDYAAAASARHLRAPTALKRSSPLGDRGYGWLALPDARGEGPPPIWRAEGLRSPFPLPQRKPDADNADYV